MLSLLGYRMQPAVAPVRPSVWGLGVSLLDNEWNSIPDDPAPAPRIVHVPGICLDERARLLRAAVERSAPVTRAPVAVAP